MPMAATMSCDVTDMDCSSAEIEELIKEVRHFFHLTPLRLALTSAPPSSVTCVSRFSLLPLSLRVTFFSDYHTCAQCVHTLPHDFHDSEVY